MCLCPNSCIISCAKSTQSLESSAALSRSQATVAVRWPGGSAAKPLSGHLMLYLVLSSVHLLESPQTNCFLSDERGKAGEKTLKRRATANTFVHTFPLYRHLSLPLTGGLALSSFDPPILIPYSWERERGQIVSDPESHFIIRKKWKSVITSRTYWSYYNKERYVVISRNLVQALSCQYVVLRHHELQKCKMWWKQQTHRDTILFNPPPHTDKTRYSE